MKVISYDQHRNIGSRPGDYMKVGQTLTPNLHIVKGIFVNSEKVSMGIHCPEHRNNI